MKISNEEQLQAACFQWHWNEYPSKRRLLFHVNNNVFIAGKAGAIQGARLKAIGVVKGPSDLILIHTGGVAFFELKFEAGTQTIEQLDFEIKVKSCGHPYFVVRSLLEFQKLVKALYLKYES